MSLDTARRALILVASSVLVACAGPSLEARDPARDPMSPRAQEAPLAAVTSLDKPDPALRPPSDDGAAQGGAGGAGGQNPAAVTYTCIMHPEVRANAPGRCPKCGMTLVPVTPRDGGTL